MFDYAFCSNSCFVLALIYLQRIEAEGLKFSVNSMNAHRLIVTAVMLAAKFHDDGHYTNSYYARVGGVSTAELNYLELEFLSIIDYRLFVSAAEFLECELLLSTELDATELTPKQADRHRLSSKPRYKLELTIDTA